MINFPRLWIFTIIGCTWLITQPLNASEVRAVLKEAGSSKTFVDLLVNEGFQKKDANRLLINKIIPTKMHVNPHEKYLVLKDPATGVTEARFYLDYSDEAVVFWRNNQSCGVDRKPIPFQVVNKTVEGRVHGSLVESIKHLITDEWAAFRFEDAFSWDINLDKQLLKNDSFKFVIEQKYDHGKLVKYGEIVDAILKTGGSVLRRILWQTESAKVFVDPTTKFEERPFYAPVDYVHISSVFTKRRLHPVRHNYQPHLGVDFALAEGSPVYAARDGVVMDAAYHHANGNFITLRHDEDYFSTYNHLNRWASDSIQVGKRVHAGDIIGYVGCTGYCTSPHLDFRIRKGDYLYNPLYLTKPYPFKERNYWESAKFKKLLGMLTSQR